MPPGLTLYSKPGCHLCDEMKALIARVSARIPLELNVVDISNDVELDRRFGSEIPVLFVNGRKVAKYRVTEMELERSLQGV